MRSSLKNLMNAVVRRVSAMRRPSKAVNQAGLLSRGEDLALFTIREVLPEDLHALAALHVKTWADTYPNVKPPSYELREQQWREQFQVTDGTWFCFVVVNPKGDPPLAAGRCPANRKAPFQHSGKAHRCTR
jgi:hypothetical protein